MQWPLVAPKAEIGNLLPVGIAECSSARANNCLPTVRCIRATLVGKIDDLRFPSLRVSILIRKISGVEAFGATGS
jgi:hypothetical protein